MSDSRDYEMDSPTKRSPGRQRSPASSRSRSRSPRRDSPVRKYERPQLKEDEEMDDSNKEARVFVGNLAFELRLEELKEFMGKVGNVVFAEIFQEGGRSKGCAVVEYGKAEEAQDAIKELAGKELLGRELFIREDREDKRYKPRESKNNQLFVGNLPYKVVWQDLKDLFRDIGKVVRADIINDRDGRSRGMGVVVFETEEEAKKAIDSFDQYEWDGRRIEVREDKKPGFLRRDNYKSHRSDRDRDYRSRDRDYDRRDRRDDRDDRDRRDRYRRDDRRDGDRYESRRSSRY
ncbi:hypothetical protein HDV06_004181 [Boothiomyces sp. JEL0866]|nr:hypothetical protein HDV06_004181 [Boothiomyces sp. JEL0866]